MPLADIITGNRLVRSAADAVLARFARKRARHLDRLDVPGVQERTLLKLVRHAAKTRFGIEHHFDGVRSVADFQARVPVRTYETFWKDYWQPVFPRLEGATWPDWIPYYALSSGTSSGATKYLPVSRQMLSSNRKSAFTTLAFYRNFAPDMPLFNGRVFFLGGNTALNKMADGSLGGDLSGIAAREILQLLRPYTFPPLKLSRIPDLETRLDAIVRASIDQPITVFSGVPSWQMNVFDRLRTLTGKSTVAEIWPTLRVVIHGGASFEPYRDSFRKILGSDRIRCLDVYPCSEGYVATEDPRYDLLRIIPDHGVFFEFVPMEEFQNGTLKTSAPTRHTLANVELGVQYAVVMTTCAGLWSYLLGDSVAFERRDPPLIRFTGRTTYFLSAFGEHLISEEVEKAVARAAHETGAEVEDHHVGPVFSTDPKVPGRHVYLIEFRTPPTDQARFAELLDSTLCRLNEDYAAHRVGDLTMKAPEIVIVKRGGVARWMQSRGKDVQGKFPRMDNSGKLTQAIWTWLKENNGIE